ncbi:MAG: hypothetical protein ACXWYP_04365 [Pseudonocardia sp.]
MAGSFAEARAQILSLQPATLRAKAGEVRRFGSASISAGTTLRASADRLGAQRGAPYQAYRERVSPTAGWLADLGRPTADTGAAIEGAAGAAERAQMVLAQQEEALARYAVNPSTTAAALAAAEAQALAVLNGAIGEVTSAYQAILPPPPTPAPVVAAGAGTSATSAGSGPVGGALGGAAAGLAAGLPNGGAERGGAGVDGAAAGSGAGGAVGSAVGAALGPTSGPFAGFVQDPTSGNLVDPATGRQADASGRFLDPITGEPFGPVSPFVSRLEGLDGGVSPVGGLLGGVPGGLGTAPGALAPVAGAGGAGSFAGGAGFVPGGALPFLGAGGAGVGAGFGTAAGRGRGGSGSFAALYGGVVPPSLSGNNPAAAQLRQQAATNLSTMAGTAQRYTAIASGQAAPGAYLPPMAGGGGGIAGGGGGATRRGGRSGPRIAEPASVWGAVGGGGSSPDRRRTHSRPTAEVEDDSVWSAGTTAPRSLDAC